MQRSNVHVSVLVPVFNEEENVARAYDRIVAVFKELPGVDYEILFTDNHSSDGTYRLVEALCAADPNVRVIRFSRNIGYQRSVLVAYQNAAGHCAVQLDCDLQDPPELIPRMLELWRSGHQVVYGVRRRLPDGPVKAGLRRAFYRVVNALSEDDLPENAGEFRLVDRRILDELRDVEDASPYVRGLISSLGFSQVGFEYDRDPRVAGESKFPLKAMLGLAVDGILNHSLIPLRLASAISLVLGVLTFAVIFAYIIGRLLFGQDWPSGFATTTVLLLASITLNAMFLGIMGEYLGRIFMQSKRRPRPIVERELNSAGARRPATPKVALVSETESARA